MREIIPGPLVIATHNRGKFAEFKDLLDPLGFTLTCNADHGLPEPEETESTFEGNALIKARAACDALGVPALADDSGLCIDTLNGDPGVYTADWAETPTGRDFPMAMEKVWGLIGETGSNPPYRAQFYCTLAMAWPDGETRIFEGKIDGQIQWPPQGEEGHGFDPIFRPDGHDKRLSEMTPLQKSEISHRADAVRQFLAATRV